MHGAGEQKKPGLVFRDLGREFERPQLELALHALNSHDKAQGRRQLPLNGRPRGLGGGAKHERFGKAQRMCC